MLACCCYCCCFVYLSSTLWRHDLSTLVVEGIVSLSIRTGVLSHSMTTAFLFLYSLMALLIDNEI